MNAGLANAHDPDVMTIGGIAPLLLAAAPDAFGEAYRAGLMAFQRDAPGAGAAGLDAWAAQALVQVAG